MILEGYAALFGVADLEGDTIHRGAFRRSTPVPMLLRHDARLRAGVWFALAEDARGLFVRGRIEADAPAGLLAMHAVTDGLDGLSIGFHTLAQRRRRGGRDLYDLDLIEISIVPRPMAPLARIARAFHPTLETTPCEKKPRWPARAAAATLMN
jgi:HK97 family phage prohead protease